MPPRIQLSHARLAQLPPAFLNPTLYASIARQCPQQTQQQQQRTIRTVVKTKHHTKFLKLSRFNNLPSLPKLRASARSAIERRIASDTLPLRTGVLATKKGMTALYSPDTGKRTPCTILQLDRVQVVGHKTARKHGYWAVQVGYGHKRPATMTRPMLGVYAGQGVAPKERVAEFRVRDAKGLLGVGEAITAGWFQEGQWVDTKSNNKGKGFAGGMKRHGWSGQPASHGQSLTHRTMGSAGGSQGSGSRVIPGKNMPGRMGNEQHTIQNLKVLKVDEANGLVLVSGPVSGPKGCIVKIQDAVKKPWPDLPGILPSLETTTQQVEAQT
ncbi:translation protein [Rhizodiscina lignyota]|uniref:Large ribosomal subunit protein uL3m n=1 Tax=Rhizodiscina lignyota TaxID=1504668 RepID=A0A9P4IJE5_9PEZI|nr:translation protein [Rhizodiscina lignyota]